MKKQQITTTNHYVYILSCADGTLYTGYTTDPARREMQHNKKVGAKYTAPRTPVKIVYLEECATKSDALKREYAIKQLSHNQKLQLIKEYSNSII